MYGSEYSLRNHVSKSSGTDCSKKHTPYTSANVYSKKVLKCEYANCNGGFSSEHSRKTHYNNEHKNPSKIIKKARTTNGKVTKPKKQPQINISKKKVALSVQAKGKKKNIILRWIIFLFSSSNTHTYISVTHHTISFHRFQSNQVHSQCSHYQEQETDKTTHFQMFTLPTGFLLCQRYEFSWMWRSTIICPFE